MPAVSERASDADELNTECSERQECFQDTFGSSRPAGSRIQSRRAYHRLGSSPTDSSVWEGPTRWPINNEWATSELFWGFYFPSQVGHRMSAEREQQPSGRHGRNLWFPNVAAAETSTEIRGCVLPGSRGWQRQQIPAAFPIRGWECVSLINQTQQRRLSALRLCRRALSSPVKQHRCRTIASSSPSLDTVCLLLWLNL